MLKDFSALEKRLIHTEPKTLVVAAAHDAHTLEAVFSAVKRFQMRYLLVGDKDRIFKLARDLDFAVDESTVIHAHTNEECAREAVRLIRTGKGDVLMKGMLETGTLLKAVLDKQEGIRGPGTMSHLTVLEVPAYNQLVAVTDAGMLTSPTLEQKADIARNAVGFLQDFCEESPKLAALAAVETVSAKMPETQDAAALQQMAERGELGDCLLEGPLSFDIAVSRESSAIKGVHSAVSGNVDILLVPGIAVGNILCKGLLYWGKAKMAGCVLGAKVPIVLVSRGATAEEKLLSILLCLSGVSM